MKELSDAKFILGMGIDHDKKAGTFMIKQSRYTDDVTQRFCQQNAKSTDNPCATNFKLFKGQSPGIDAEATEMHQSHIAFHRLSHAHNNMNETGHCLRSYAAIKISRESWNSALAGRDSCANILEVSAPAWNCI